MRKRSAPKCAAKAVRPAKLPRFYEVRVLYKTELRTGSGTRILDQHVETEWRDRRGLVTRGGKVYRRGGAAHRGGLSVTKRLNAQYAKIERALKGGR
ncbi:MAG: hypothetical protein ACI4RA_11220 [Kiritimatiellia bacterium]